MELGLIKGIGPKSVQLLSKLGINSIEELVHFFPYKYLIYEFNNIDDKLDTYVLNVIVESTPTIFYINKSLNRISFRANCDGRVINVSIFNRNFIKQHIYIGRNITIIGKFGQNRNSFTASEIKFDIVPGSIESIYHLTKGLSNKNIQKFIASSLDNYNEIDYIPEIISKKDSYLDKKSAVRNIHFPKDLEMLSKAKQRLKYEELFQFSFKMNYLKKSNQAKKGIPKNVDEDKMKLFINSLPFNLTEDQKKVYEEVLSDTKSDNRMNRLVLGDVGSGKTIVSTLGVYMNYTAGYQSALMAPTEILAIQHYYGIKELFKNFNLSVEIITGSMTKKEKQKIYERVTNGDVDLLVGTPSILNENIIFNKLGLVITDEQHRFGVNQRGVLFSKGITPDVLYLSATPIPRTYAMTIYGDMDISLIKSKPMGRLPIITKVKKEKEIKDVLLSILEEIKKGHQIYVVSPAVEQNDETDTLSVIDIKEKLDMAYKGKIRTDIIHGKMKQSEKDVVMNDFKNKKIHILIATTVIEVGIDIPNATSIVIFNAEKFGLATLHQLRGRVGRNNIQSYCYLISNSENERLKVMEESNDGFYISKKDFEMRGHGDLFGTRQSGEMSFSLADLREDYDILVKAKNDSDNYIKSEMYKESEYYSSLAETLNIVD